MKIAIEGCCHGKLDLIYDKLLKLQEREGIKIDLLLCCGDFQAIRDQDDLNCMAVPDKYKEIGSFHKYYSGKEKAPILTIFIGGNHEASNYLRELGYGGWVAPNIYYIGYCGVVLYGGVRIAGLSGIYNYHNYNKGHFEVPPFSRDTLRSVYHVRASDLYRMKNLKNQIDIMMSHDWPCGIHRHGNEEKLFQMKPFFKEEADRDQLGCPPAMELLNILKPCYWFSAHLHCKFSAVYHHGNGLITKFLALDKCLPHRGYIQVIDVPSLSSEPPVLKYDLEWLSILKGTESLMHYTSRMWNEPDPEHEVPLPSLPEIEKSFDNDLTIPLLTIGDFSKEATRIAGENPQSRLFCQRLGIDNPWKLKPSPGREDERKGSGLAITPLSLPPPIHNPVPYNPDEIFIDDIDDDDDDDDDDDKRLKLEEPELSSATPTANVTVDNNKDDVATSDGGNNFQDDNKEKEEAEVMQE
ncbi:PREDICTED: lariat debranching enzyme-like isoform X1 [Amphimedon queenslandica]|nr:PREDICTED: lariat debranching enzyme-like isoform X1 [Amphimedon queenslandica]|eukprot:XP_003384492.1 PREDICTED: lariat debranching enzyme-like isoform X1 [Amphimedon queenslandica]